MKVLSGKFFTICIISIFMLLTTVSHASETDQGWPLKDKVPRGINNTAFGFLEVPDNIDKFQKERDWFEASTTGLALGVGRALARTGAGIGELVTFLCESTEGNAPLMDPEYATDLLND